MKRLIKKHGIICMTLFAAFLLTNCTDRMTPAPPISPDGFPTITLSKDTQTNTVTEGATIKYTFTSDKPLKNATPFTMYDTSGTASGGDYVVSSAVYPSFIPDTSATLPVTFKMDNIPEKTETITFKLGIDPVNNAGLRQTINPNSSLPEQTITIENHNDPTGLTVAYQWPNTDDDLDVLVLLDKTSNNATDPLTPYILAASSSDPEIPFVENGYPDGTYYYSVNPYSVNESVVPYKFLVGYPNQKVEIYEGEFNVDEPDSTLQTTTFRGGIYTILFKVQKTDTTYTVTHIDK